MSYSQMMHPSYLRVSFPAPETYFEIPSHWKIEDLKVVHGQLYHKGKATLLIPHDCVSTKQDLEIINEGHMDYEDCRSFLG